jgi:uncharacterized protein (TIGR01244 family)
MRRPLAPLLALLALLVAVAALADEPPQLRNVRDPLPALRTGGIPEGDEIYPRLAAEGFRTVVDLRGDAEPVEAARAAAEAAGLAYVRIPIAGDADLDLGSARALDAVLDDPARGPVVLACASGNRSGALLAVRAFWLEGASADEALALGRAAGLTRLEPSVRRLLGLPPAEPE